MELVPDSALLNRAVMVVWHGGTTPEVLQPLVERLRERVGEKGRVMLENADRLESIPHEESSVEVVLTGFLPPPSLTHSPLLLAELAQLLKPSGLLFLREPVTTTTTASGSVEGVRSVKKLMSALKLSGFVDVSEVEVSKDSGLLAGLQANGVTVGQDTISVAFVSAKKPSYEVGASSTLSFANQLPQPANKVSSETAKVWSLDPADDNLDLLDSDTLLEEEDMIKPDPASLRSQCGPNSGRKRACKDCTCGLREELENGNPVTQTRTVTSSCGSCYLGDAFRCASCPYLGMPAFKSGEQIRLSSRQLKADQ